jgi:hypothetical protein
MTGFTILFYCFAAWSVVILLSAAFAAKRGRGRRALKILRVWGVLAALYFGTVLAVALVPQIRVLTAGDRQCSEYWCMAVESVRSYPSGSRITYEIDFLISNTSGSSALREKRIIVYLVGGAGARFEPYQDDSQLPFNTLVPPMKSIRTTRRFEVPASTGRADLVIEQTGFQIGWFIIGHRPFDGHSIIHVN